ncbi:NADPH-dependent FMN reductase [Gloeobacter kilaueensis]|uniref:NADPH-dependent FMN reductase n=1 Tax=Gloeobacter kilaueensis (strain ATCC BAA-2537 / CCAP 1431/1 / ULC 316 / JS1) TaxID=1183438 RepID=U5QM91_GLOK1|nr:NADPH-dependent FMN reductase [Gloeobacter kilaueensis]AGY60107.1 NADPH-dependent FMN reductase [Gloeobacter kilaueensis JS1]
MVKIIGLCGSLRASSYSEKALLLALAAAERAGAEVEYLDFKKMDLPFCDGGDSYPDHPDVQVLKSKVKAAAGLIISTPEYHGSFSGVIKNALDLMSFEEFTDKVWGVISVLGGGQNSNALNDLRTVARWVHSWVVREQVAIGQAWKQFDTEGKLVDPKLQERLDKLAQEVVRSARLFRVAD